jgi:long-chain fatty acid transport protein
LYTAKSWLVCRLIQNSGVVSKAWARTTVTYNPAAITRLPGLQLQAGLDFANAEDRYTSASGTHEARHTIQFPPSVYLTWRAPQDSVPIAFGLGVDSPFWTNMDWHTALFPGRFLTRRFELEVFELHTVMAYEFAEGWSFGAGLRYLYGGLEQADNQLADVFVPSLSRFETVEVLRDADVDALGWNLALHYAAPSSGWGTVFRNEAELEGNGTAEYTARDVLPVPDLEAAVRALFVPGRASQSFTLPWELRAGTWFAPYPELRIEVDIAYLNWSTLERTDITLTPNRLGPAPLVVKERNWKDTVSVRLGAEGELTDNFQLFGGVGWEPSPVRGNTVEPGFPRDDAYVYAAGFAYNFPQISFDLAYSFHDHGNRGASEQEPRSPDIAGSYTGREQVWGFSARWRF